MKEPCIYERIYKGLAVVVALGDAIVTIAMALALALYLYPPVNMIAILITILVSMTVCYRACKWLTERASMIARLAELCGTCPIVHRVGREACCMSNGKCICVDLVYGDQVEVEISRVLRKVKINPLAPLNFYAATPLGDGEVLTLSCREANTLLEARGSVKRLHS